MKRITTLMLLLSIVAIGAKAQLLYKITGNGLTAPSYIIGTYHLAPVSFVDSIPGILQAMDNVEQVYGELDMTDMLSPENLQKVRVAMMLPEGKTLNTLLSEDEMNSLNTLLRKVIGMDLTNPLLAQQLNKLTPSAIATQLSMLSYLKKAPGFDPNNPFDGYFQKVAKEQGKGVGGLESLDFQMEVLYKGQTLERQKEVLMGQIKHWDVMDKMADGIIKAFFKQDLEAINEALDIKTGDVCDPTPEEEAQLIDNRNTDWLTKMPAIMQAKPTLFAVGAGHLPGENGVLNLLKVAGYTVEGIR